HGHLHPLPSSPTRRSSDLPDEPRAVTVERELPPRASARSEVVGARPKAGSRGIDRAEQHSVDEHRGPERVPTRADRPARVDANFDALTADTLCSILEIVVARIHGQHVPGATRRVVEIGAIDPTGSTE